MTSTPKSRAAQGIRWAVVFLSLTAFPQSLTACLAFKDFDVVEQEDLGGEAPPCAGPFECLNDVLRSCENGVRKTVEDCRQTGRYCNSQLLACAECRPGKRRCEDDVLFRCTEEGQFEVDRDCASENLYCTEAREEYCVPCIHGRKYCAPRGPDDEFDQLFACLDYEIPETTSDCPFGCLGTGQGTGEGECAKCPAELAGKVYCSADGSELERCPMDRTQPVSLEQECPFGCDPSSATAECLTGP